MGWHRSFLIGSVVLLSFILSGCPAVSGPDGPETTVQQLGMVTIGASFNEAGTYEVYGAGGLFLPVERTIASLEQVTDRCLVNDSPPVLPEEAFKTLLDAGEVIDVRTNGEPFAALVRINFIGGGYGYTAGEFGMYPAIPGQGLVATIPGAAFPSFKAEFPAPPPQFTFAGGQQTTVPLSLDGSFTWEPYVQAGVVSFLDFQVYNPDFESDSYVLANCIAVDDGEFSLPPEARDAIRAIDPAFAGEVNLPERSVYRVERQGNAALALGIGDDLSEALLR